MSDRWHDLQNIYFNFVLCFTVGKFYLLTWQNSLVIRKEKMQN